MASASAFSDLLAQASMHFEAARPFLPMYTHLIISALFPIYAGARASLSRPSSAAKPDKKAKKAVDSEDEEEDEDQIQKMEGLSNSDAILLPVTAALVLGGLYFLIKRYGADLINLVMGWYFSGIGVFSVAKLVNDGANMFVGLVFPTYFASGAALWKVDGSQRKTIKQHSEDTKTIDCPSPPPLSYLPLPQWFNAALWNVRRGLREKYTVKAYISTILDLRANVTIVNILSALVGVGTIVYVNTVSKPWFLTNLQGFAVCYSALQLMSPTTFATGSLILGALFCYDIWAVFFTPLMVTVAKNLDQPIKLVFPRPDEPSETPGEPPIKSFSMLGLGDIVLPGIMIGLALRFDLYMFYLRKQKKSSKTVVDPSGQTTTQEVVEKAPYVSVTGHWGDRFWTILLSAASLPPQLKSSFPKPYFAASMVGYVAGMLTTLGVMSVFRHAQPALLYLVPGVLISLWGTAVVRRELGEMWDFSEAVLAESGTVQEGKDEEVPKSDGKDGKADVGLFGRLWAEVWTGKGQEKEPSADKSDAQSEANKKPRSEGRKEAKPSSKKQQEHGLLFSFSIARFNPNATSTAVNGDGIDAQLDADALDGASSLASDRSEGGIDVQPGSDAHGSASSSASDSSEEAVVVSSTDLETPKDSGEPRYRMRSTRADTAD